jgi:hypothetical protein
MTATPTEVLNPLLETERVEPREPPLEGKNQEIQILPTLITFFCNPYALRTDAAAERTPAVRSDTVKEINLGIMGQIDETVRIALFSTLSMFPFLGEPMFRDRGECLQDKMMHRFSFLLSVSPLPHFFLGAAGGAQVHDSPRVYTLEFLLEARIRY